MKFQPDDEPLGMVVHNLPDPGNIGQATTAATGRWKLLAIMLVCSIPVVAAYFAFLYLRPQGAAAFGEFINPIRPVGALSGVSLDGAAQPLAALNGRWLLVSVAGGACDALCQRQLYIQRQLRATLGEDKARVDRVWLIPDQAAVEPALRTAMGDAVVLRVRPAELRDWLAPPPGKELGDYLFVVDPLGNAMMRFPAQVNVEQAARMQHDLERLLRTTAAWPLPNR